MSGTRLRPAAALAAAAFAALVAAAPAGATAIDLGALTTGSLGTDSISITAADGNVVTFRAIGSAPDATLKVSNFVGSVFDRGICAADTSFGTWLSDCELPLEISFARPVDELVFEQQGVQVLDATGIVIETAEGGTTGGSVHSLANVNLLGILDGRQIDLSWYEGITRIQLDAHALLSTGTSFGDFSFESAAPVPAPPAMLGLLTGVAALAAVRRRRARG